MKQLSITLLLFALTPFISLAQFEDIGAQLEALGVDVVSPSNGYGSGVSFYDFNGDGWDDLSFSGGDDDPVFLINNQGTWELAPFAIPNFGDARIYSIIWVDFDNDGDSDLFISRQNGPMQLWENDGNMNFTNIAVEAGLEQGNFVYSNATWADYDHDGCLDFYITKSYSFFNYLDTMYTSILYRNNCDGTFTDVTASSGVQLIPRTELQPIWADFNNDGWEDLYLSVDRMPFQNELFVNNQDGTFTRRSASSGLDDHLDSMGPAIGDYNQDGYLDIYVGNNPINPGNAFYRNNGDLTFTNIAPEMGLDLGIESTLSTWGATWIDHDNNTWEDLLLATMIFGQAPHPGSRLYRNNEGESFTLISDSANINTPFGTETFVVARGDFNNDGYFDYATGNRNPYTPRLKRNIGGENNYLSVELEGTISNRDGIGAWIHCYVDGRHFVRYTMCGESLAAQHSSKEIFGLGQYTQVDSLIVEWNMGTREIYENVAVNQQLYLVEGASFQAPVEVTIIGDTEMCYGDSIILDAGDAQSCIWSNGHEGPTLTVYEAGSYTVTATNEFGLTNTSLPIVVTVAPEAEVDFNVEGVSCANAADGSIELTVSTAPLTNLLWSNEGTNTTLTGLSGGIYTFTATDVNGCPVSGEVSVNEPSPLFAQANPTNALCYGDSTGSVVAQWIGGTPPMTVNWMGQNPDAVPAGSYMAILTDSHGCTSNLSYIIDEPDSLSVSLVLVDENSSGENGSADVTISGGTPPYNIVWSTGDEGTSSIDGLSAGNYGITITDDHGCVWTMDFEIMNITGMRSLSSDYLTVYPNPARDGVLFSGSTTYSLDISVLDAAGRLVLRVENHTASAWFDIADLAPGSYLIQVQDGAHEQFLRLVVTHK